VDLRESITIGDVGDIFTIPANIEKTFDQITKPSATCSRRGRYPSSSAVTTPSVTRRPGVTEHLDGKLGVIHFDRHVDTQKTDLDERMHTTPMANAAATILGVDADELAGLGYRQELHRSLGAFAGFSFVSTLTTTFQLFALGFFFGGPAFVWTWPIVFVGQMAVALVFAEL
jgi:arginase family enzyme